MSKEEKKSNSSLLQYEENKQNDKLTKKRKQLKKKKKKKRKKKFADDDDFNLDREDEILKMIERDRKSKKEGVKSSTFKTTKKKSQFSKSLFEIGEKAIKKRKKKTKKAKKAAFLKSLEVKKFESQKGQSPTKSLKKTKKNRKKKKKKKKSQEEEWVEERKYKKAEKLQEKYDEERQLLKNFKVKEKATQWITKDQMCIYGSFVLFFIWLLYGKYQGEKFRRLQHVYGSDTFESLYEVLEIDENASIKDVKSQYRKLAKVWHPDRNPKCGQPCEVQFRKITDAYKILSNPTKKDEYDRTAGVLSVIPSKTITINDKNYKKLLKHTNDIWIIQIYDDTSDYCKQFSSIWEEVAKIYGITVKFGRINAAIEIEVQTFLPYTFKFYPSIISYQLGYQSDIYTLDRTRPLNHVIQTTFEQFTNMQQAWNNGNKFSEEDCPITMFYFLRQKRPPLTYKYKAFKVIF